MDTYPTIRRSTQDAFLALAAIRDRDPDGHLAIRARARTATADALGLEDGEVRAVLRQTSALPSTKQDEVLSLHALYLEDEVNAYCDRWIRNRLRRNGPPPPE
jgi:hypothetical protein